MAHRMIGGTLLVAGWCCEREADAMALAAIVDMVFMAILEYA